MSGYRGILHESKEESDLELNQKESLITQEEKDPIRFTGWLCTGLALVIPLFIIGSIICGIKIIEKKRLREGITMLCVAPVVAILGMAVISFTAMQISNAILINQLKQFNPGPGPGSIFRNP